MLYTGFLPLACSSTVLLFPPATELFWWYSVLLLSAVFTLLLKSTATELFCYCCIIVVYPSNPRHTLRSVLTGYLSCGLAFYFVLCHYLHLESCYR